MIDSFVVVGWNGATNSSQVCGVHQACDLAIDQAKEPGLSDVYELVWVEMWPAYNLNAQRVFVRRNRPAGLPLSGKIRDSDPQAKSR